MIYGMLGNQGVNNPALAVYWLAQALPKVFMHPKIIENAIRQAQPGFGTTREVAWLKVQRGPPFVNPGHLHDLLCRP